MKNILLAITHPDEWNQLLPFNSYIKSIKDSFDYVITVAPYKSYIVFTEADEIVTVKDGDLFSYPSILENLTSRRNDEFLKRCVDFCIDKYGLHNLVIKSWQNTIYDDGMVDEINKPGVEYYRTSFDYARKFFNDGLIVTPTEEIFKKVSLKYKNIFDENTFILLTRNFNQKTNVHNTKNMLPYLEETLEFLCNNGLKIVNIGFPPQSYEINSNYLEINDDLTQDELISLFYLSRGVIMSPDSGGFVTHYGSNVDFYLLNEEWSVLNQEVGISLVDSKKTNQTISLIGFSNEKILQSLLENSRPQKKEFSNPKKINIVS